MNIRTENKISILNDTLDVVFGKDMNFAVSSSLAYISVHCAKYKQFVLINWQPI